MNARKVMFILGAILLALVAAFVAVALFSHKKMETEKNRTRTEAARKVRHEPSRKEESSIQVDEQKEPGLKEEVLTQSENEIV